jgi:hypothetical protein
MTQTEVDFIIQELRDLRKCNDDAHAEILRQQHETNGRVRTHEDILNNKEQGLIKRVLNLEKKTWLLIIVVSSLSGVSGAFGSQWMEEVLRQSTSANIFQTFARLITGG